MRISDWSSDVCSSDLRLPQATGRRHVPRERGPGDSQRRAARHPEHDARPHGGPHPDEPRSWPFLPVRGDGKAPAPAAGPPRHPLHAHRPAGRIPRPPAALHAEAGDHAPGGPRGAPRRRGEPDRGRPPLGAAAGNKGPETTPPPCMLKLETMLQEVREERLDVWEILTEGGRHWERLKELKAARPTPA